MGDDRAAILAQQIQRLLREQEEGPRHIVADIVKQYLVSVEFGNLKAHHTEAIRFRCHVLPHLGDRVAEELDFKAMAWYREQRRGEKCLNGHAGAPAAATRNREIIVLSACFSWAVKHAILTINPIRGAPMESENNQRRTKPDAADIEKLLFVCSRRLRAMIAMSFGAGLRRGELCSLPLRQITWSEGLIELHGRDTKTGRPRVTVLPELASKYLRKYLDTRPNESQFVFSTKKGKPISPRNFLREFQDACTRAGLVAAAGERMWLHDLRAGFICHQLELGTPQRVIMDMTGHSTHKAFDRYVRVQREWISAAKARADLFDATRKGPQSAKPEAALGHRAEGESA